MLWIPSLRSTRSSLAASSLLLLLVVFLSTTTTTTTTAALLGHAQQQQQLLQPQQQSDTTTTTTTTTTTRNTNSSNSTTRTSSTTSSRVLIHIPFALHNASGEEHVFATQFGLLGGGGGHHLNARGSLSAFTYYYEGNLCHAVDLVKEATNQNKTTTKLHPTSANAGANAGANAILTSPFLLLATASTMCSPVLQARHAQQAGAVALIMADPTCRCSDTACTSKFGPDCVPVSDATDRNNNEPALPNDGSGADVHIPVVWLYKVTATALQEQMKQHQQAVLLELAWGLPSKSPDGMEKKDDDNTTSTKPVVTYHLWTTAHDPIVDLETMRNLKTVVAAFWVENKNSTSSSSSSSKHQVVEFAPRFSILNGADWNCDKQVDANGPCDHLCSNHGRYCSVHARELSGHAIVAETLRRLCIWQEYSSVNDDDDDDDQNKIQKKKSPLTYWDYLLYHFEHCYDPHQYANADCLQNAYAAAQIDAHVIDQCMKDAGDLDQDVPNTLLQGALGHQERAGVTVLPALSVNHHVIDTGISSFALFKTICEEFWNRDHAADVPAICHACAGCANVIGCIKAGHCVNFTNPDNENKHDSNKKSSTNNKRKRHPVRNFFLFVLLVFAAACAYYYYKIHMAGGGYSFQDPSSGGILNGYLQLQNTD